MTSGQDNDNDKDLPLRVGVFDTVDQASGAVQALKGAGFDTDRIAVVCSSEAKRDAFPEVETMPPAGDTAGEKAAEGGAIGAALGGVATLAIATTGGLPLVAAGAFLLLAGAGAGTFVGAMTSRGVEPEVADFYDQALEQGRIVVAAFGDADKAERALRDAGAKPVELPHKE